MNRHIKTGILGIYLLSCLFLIGCDSSRTLGQMSGHVSLDGQPCGGQLVVFGCAEQRVFITAKTGEDGSYTVQMAEGKGLPLGTYEVSVRLAPSSNFDRPPQYTTPIPRRYMDPKTSGLQVIVAEGVNQFDISMTTNPAAAR